MPLTREQFDRVMAAHESRLRVHVLNQIGSNQGLDVDEAIQDVRIRLWKALSSEREITHLASYVRRTVVSAVIDALRRRRARREDALDSLEAAGADAAAAGGGPERTADRAQRIALARAAIATLPERRRVPAQLLLQGFTTQEIARMLGYTEATARNLAYRGVEEIREGLRAAGTGDWDD